MAFNFSGNLDVLQIGVAAYMMPQDARRYRAEGSSDSLALAKAGRDAFITSAFSIPTATLLPLVPAAVRGLIHFGQQSSVNTRGRVMPFSNRYEHSQQAAQMQSYALSRMGAMSGLGNEAAAAMNRYR